MNAIGPFTAEIDLLKYELDRTDRFYKLQIQINLLASVIFGLSSFVFEHFKSFEASRWTFAISATFLAITTVISILYTYSVFRDRNKDYDAAKQAINNNAFILAQKSLIVAEKTKIDKDVELLQKKIDQPVVQEKEVNVPSEDDDKKVKGKEKGKGKGKQHKGKTPPSDKTPIGAPDPHATGGSGNEST